MQSPAKQQPANTIVNSAQPPSDTPPLALYLHVPFCRTRCVYCAFNTYTGLAHLVDPFIRALAREVRLVGAGLTRSAQTIYIGGGTPSLLAPSQLEQLLGACFEAFDLCAEPEITLEVNPGTTNRKLLCDLRQLDVNRLSIGMQSAHADELRFFRRNHRLAQVQHTVEDARYAGFDSVSLDLIYGAPFQTLARWEQSLHVALSMMPDHLSLYSLSVEEATPLERQIESEQVPAPDSDQAADMYELARNMLARAGYVHYEISNWAKPGHACQHNIHYWRSRPYLGFGPGAHGYVDGMRTTTILDPPTYIARITAQHEPLPFPRSAATERVETPGIGDQMAEMMFMQLRLLTEGVTPSTFEARFGRTVWDVFGPALNQLIAHGLLHQAADGNLRLTPRAYLVSNLVFREFMPDMPLKE